MASEIIVRSEARRAAASGRLRALRAAARVSLREFASAVGVTPAAVSRWEAGERSPRGEIAARLGHVMRELEESLDESRSERGGFAAASSCRCEGEATLDVASSLSGTHNAPRTDTTTEGSTHDAT